MAGLKRFPKYSEVYEDGKLILSEYNLEAINNLVEVVVNKHFALYNEQEELISVGFLKCLELLEGHEFDPLKYPHKSALKNFLYTGIRNEVGNYLYHNRNSKKEFLTDETPPYLSDVGGVDEIPESIVYKYAKDNNINPKEFLFYLSKQGFPVLYKPVEIITSEYHLNKHLIFFLKDYVNNLGGV